MLFTYLNFHVCDGSTLLVGAVVNMADMDVAVMELVVVDMEVIDKVLVVDMVSGVRVVTKTQWSDTPCTVNTLNHLGHSSLWVIPQRF